MIDIECLDTQPTAAILSISAILFDPFEYNQDLSKVPVYDELIDLESQENRSISQETIDWWAKQNTPTKDKIFSEDGRIPLKEALQKLTKFVWNKTSKIWVQGISLDIPVLDHAFHEVGLSVPWQYFILRDSRTLRDLVYVEDNDEKITHDSLEDVKQQARSVQKVLNQLQIDKFVKK